MHYQNFQRAVLALDTHDLRAGLRLAITDQLTGKDPAENQNATAR